MSAHKIVASPGRRMAAGDSGTPPLSGKKQGVSCEKSGRFALRRPAVPKEPCHRAGHFMQQQPAL